MRDAPMSWRSVVGLTALAALLLAGNANAQAAETTRQYQFEPGANGYDIVLKEVPRPEPGANEVLVQVHATSLNRRDISMLHGNYGRGGDVAGGIPLSDGAGEVIAVGPGVSRFRVGDRGGRHLFQCMDRWRANCGHTWLSSRWESWRHAVRNHRQPRTGPRHDSGPSKLCRSRNLTLRGGHCMGGSIQAWAASAR